MVVALAATVAKVVQNIFHPRSDKSKYWIDNVANDKHLVAIAALKFIMTGSSGRKKCNFKCNSVICDAILLLLWLWLGDDEFVCGSGGCGCCRNVTNLINSGRVQLKVMALLLHGGNVDVGVDGNVLLLLLLQFAVDDDNNDGTSVVLLLLLLESATGNDVGNTANTLFQSHSMEHCTNSNSKLTFIP